MATELGKALARNGHEIHFMATDVPFRLGTFIENVYIHEIVAATYPVLRTPSYDFSLAALIAKVVDEYNLDVVHAHYAMPFAVCAYLAKQMAERDVKIVTTLHGTDITVLAQDEGLKQVIQLGIEKSDAVTAVSRSLIGQTKELFETAKPIECVYNFVDTDVFHPGAGSQIRHSLAHTGERVILHMSNFRAVKRMDDVIDIFARIVKKTPAKLVLVGVGPEYNHVRHRVQALGLNPFVLFLGKQEEVASLVAAADLLLLPSEKESFGLVALEAMACGIPVIGSTAGGIPEVVEDGVTGFLAPIGDVEKMVRDSLRLLGDESRYQAFSKNARHRAIKHFHIRDKVSEYEANYDRLCK